MLIIKRIDSSENHGSRIIIMPSTRPRIFRISVK